MRLEKFMWTGGGRDRDSDFAGAGCPCGRKAGRRKEQMALLAFYKPRGVVCTTDRRWGDRIIEDVLDYPQRVFYIGRLDKDSEGLLLMTNNGDIVNKIMREGNAHEKEYLVTVDKPVTEDFLKGMRAGGLVIQGRKTLPCRVWKTGGKSFGIVLTQGLNRQIRRMCAHFGREVVTLKRVRVMNIRLGDYSRALRLPERSRSACLLF